MDKSDKAYEGLKLFMRTYPTATFNDITEAFPDRLQGSYGVAEIKYKIVKWWNESRPTVGMKIGQLQEWKSANCRIK